MKYNKSLQTNLCRGFGFVFCMVMLLTYLPLSASAEENTNNVIRVGAFEGLIFYQMRKMSTADMDMSIYRILQVMRAGPMNILIAAGRPVLMNLNPER